MTEQPSEEKKKPLSDEERLALCKKLDEELDDFINGLEKKRYTEGWPEDRWEEEMDKHPFFMKQAPVNGELSPLAEGLAKLKYDPEENTPFELANSYKEDGNFNFKHRNYRLAIIGFTEGIKVKCDDFEMQASLYNNRAAAHLHLKNFRSSLSDSEKALTFNPQHTKARLRAAKSAMHISKFDKCLEHCQIILEKDPSNKEVVELRNTARKEKLIQERNLRKKCRIKSKTEEQIDAVLQAITLRGIRISNCEDASDIDLSKLEPCLPGAADAMVHFENGILKWPVLFLYPEYQMTDFIIDCPENVPLMNQLEQLFPAPWDEGNKYSCETVNLYFEGYDKMPHVICPTENLGDLLLLKYFELKAGTPTFSILPRGSVVEKRFLESFL